MRTLEREYEVTLAVLLRGVVAVLAGQRISSMGGLMMTPVDRFVW